MAFESQDDESRRDDTATERPEESAPEHDEGPEESGGPYGNPAVDEESLRKQQEDSSERSD